MDIPELVSKAKQGNPDAFGLIYDVFSQKIYRYIQIKIQSKQECEDILQEVFIKAWRALPNFKMENSNFNAWLYRIAANAINDYFRKKYRRPETVELKDAFNIAGTDSPQENLTRALDDKMLAKALDLLPVNYREVLELRFVQDFTLEETAKVLGKSNVTVRVLQFRALKKLQEQCQISNVKFPT